MVLCSVRVGGYQNGLQAPSPAPLRPGQPAGHPRAAQVFLGGLQGEWRCRNLLCSFGDTDFVLLVCLFLFYFYLFDFVYFSFIYLIIQFLLFSICVSSFADNAFVFFPFFLYFYLFSIAVFLFYFSIVYYCLFLFYFYYHIYISLVSILLFYFYFFLYFCKVRGDAGTFSIPLGTPNLFWKLWLM